MWLLVSKTHCFGTVRLGLLCSGTKGIWQPNNNNQESNLARAQSPASVVVVGSTQAWSMRNFLGKNAAVAASSSSWRSNSSNASPSFQRATLAKAENQPRLLAYVKQEGLRLTSNSSLESARLAAEWTSLDTASCWDKKTLVSRGFPADITANTWLCVKQTKTPTWIWKATRLWHRQTENMLSGNPSQRQP